MISVLIGPFLFNLIDKFVTLVLELFVLEECVCNCDFVVVRLVQVVIVSVLLTMLKCDLKSHFTNKNKSKGLLKNDTKRNIFMGSVAEILFFAVLLYFCILEL